MTDDMTRSDALPTLGIRVPNSGPLATESAILDIAGWTDELGYDTVWVHDHISWPHEKLTHFAAGSIEICADQDPNFFESIATLAVLAGRLQRVRVGVAGLVLPLRDPRVLAKQIATIDRLTGSRMVVAAGIGAIEGDFATMGVPFKRRGRMTDDHLAALEAILGAEQPVSHDGEFVSFASGTFLPAPARWPIWLTASGDVGLRRAARFGAGWLTAYKPAEAYHERAQRLSELVVEAGRDPAELTYAYETYVCVAETGAEAEAICRASLEHKFGDFERGRDVCIVGDVDEVARRIHEYGAAGAQHIELKFIAHDVPQIHGMMELVAERLLAPVA